MAGRVSIYDDYKNISIPKLKIGYFSRFYTSFNISNDFGNFSYSIGSQVNTTIQQALKNLKAMQQDTVSIEMPLIEFKKFLRISVEIVIASSSVIGTCAQPSYDKYFQDKLRFEFDAPYHSFQNFIESPLLTNEWKSFFSIGNLNNTKYECQLKKNNYDELKKQYIEFFDFWFAKNSIDAFVFPTSNTLPYKLNETDDTVNVSPTILSPFLGYPSLNIPIGFSSPYGKNIDGLPIGMLILTKHDNLLNILKIAKRYEKLYLTETKLPKITPLINQPINLMKCDEKFFLSSATINRNSMMTILQYYIIFHFKL